MGTWCKMLDGVDFGESRVICGIPFDSNPGSFTHLLTMSSATAIYDDDYFLGGCETTVQNPLRNPTNFFPMNKQGCDKILPLNLPNTKQEPISSENTESVDCKTPKDPSSLTSKIPATKKRKSLQRRIMQIPMEEGSWNKQGGAGVPSDHWSWRKYGQKPIKGSPYPRGYYRCSSSKGCPARKQLERSFRDPSMLLITYTQDHNHALPAHRGARVQTSSSSLLPHASDSDNHHDSASPPNESQEEKQRPNSEIVDSSIEEGGPNNLVNSSIEEGNPYNHVVEDNLFADFGEPPELDFANHSEEEEGSTMVDPFNLFDWSFSTTEWSNS